MTPACATSPTGTPRALRASPESVAADTLEDGQLYFHQWRSGRDIAVGDPVADGFANYAYALGDRGSGTAVLVDPSHAPVELAERVAADGMTLVGAVLTHFHADHAGGAIGEYAIAGVAELVAVSGVPVHLHIDDAEYLLARSRLPASALVTHHDHDRLALGALAIDLLHTPGHTPGSQCLYTGELLLTGDTLFLLGCGRTDGPGGDAAALYESLFSRLGSIPDATMVFPGHDYASAPAATLGLLRARNPVLFNQRLEEWLARFSG